MTIPAPLLAHYQSGATTVAWGVKIVRADGEVYGWTSCDRDSPALDGVVYRSAPGLDVKAFATSAGLAVDNTNLEITPDATVITRADILAGRWNNAAYTLFRYNWNDAAIDSLDDCDIRSKGRLGELQARGGIFVAELRGPQQPVQQPVGAHSSKNCRARLGDAMCTVDIEDAANKKSGTLTHVISKQAVRDSSRTEGEDFFGEGTFTITSGANANLSQKVKSYAADGTINLSLPMIMAMEVGDTYTITAGCRKRLLEDCRDKFDNILNFQGEPHRPTMDELTSAPEVSV